MTAAANLKAKARAQQVDWLALVEPRGQFLTVPILRQAFPSGLEPVAADIRAEARERARALDPRDPGSITSWLEWLMRDLLQWGERLRTGPEVPDQLAFTVAEHAARLRPEYALLDKDGRARVIIERYGPSTRLDARIPGDRWAASPIDRAGVLCRALAIPIALVTNGQHIALVYAPQDKVGGYATWDTALFAEGAEATLLSAFVDLLGAKSFFARAPENQLEQLLARSAEAQAELTTTLGLQVRRAVELLVSSLSRANLEAGGMQLRGIAPHRIYEAASTVVMRLVFLLYAEERHLLPLGEEVYDQNYAISTMLEELQSESDLLGDEPLELRADAWQRILATTRAVYAGVSHDRLRMPAYHGSLFDPDRYPFLEGRTEDQPWHETPARPMRVDDLTVREILRALQVITTSHGGTTEARRLSFRALDVEQIGHVYEGLLDHSALRAETVVLGLVGQAGIESEVTLDALEQAAAGGNLAEYVTEQSGKTSKQVAKLLGRPITDEVRRGLLAACDNDVPLVARLEPFAHLLRDDLRGLPTVYIPGTVYVTETSHRRDTGTEYTTRELADEIVKYTLEPLVYSPGPQDGAEPADWKLKSPDDILSLTVCDPAVGSGAILVAACRYLASRLVESRLERDETPDGYVNDPSVPAEEDELVVQARRDVADRCLFGVDRDPIAVEMAKLSLWLTTLSKERPFTFVDHAIQTGDSLLGISDLDQLYALHLDPQRGRQLNYDLFVDLNSAIKPTVDAALDARHRLEALSAITVRDIEHKARLNAEAMERLREAQIIADLITGAALASESRDAQFEALLDTLRPSVSESLVEAGERRTQAFTELAEQAQSLLNQRRPAGSPLRRPLHWPLAFPEVFARGGFSAFVGNPPFLGGKRISGPHGSDFREYLVRWIANGRKGNADLVSYFFLRANRLCQTLGFLATNTVAQGDTREVGLDKIVASGSSIFRAVKSRPWPGNASLEVSQVWTTSQPWQGPRVLNGLPVREITSQLESLSRVKGMPHRLSANAGIAFIGSALNTTKFILTAEEADYLVHDNADSMAVVAPLLNGEDLNSTPSALASRWTINFREWPEHKAAAFAAPFKLLEERVKPDVLAKGSSYSGWSTRWWQFWRTRAELYDRLETMPTCIALTRVSNTIMPARVPSQQVFSDALTVFASDSADLFAVLSSQFHWHWAVRYASSLGSGTRYTPSDVFETFPRPMPTTNVEDLGHQLNVERRELQSRLNSGLTKLYNRVHDPSDNDHGIQRLRALHYEIDAAIREAYGWVDLDLNYGFHPTAHGIRWTFDPSAQSEALDRLLELNFARYAEETATTTTSSPTPRRRVQSRISSTDDQMTLEMP